MDTATLEVTTNVKTVRFYGERLGTVQEMAGMLHDLDAAYNSIARFPYIVDTIVSNNKDQLIEIILAEGNINEITRSVNFPKLKLLSIHFGSAGFLEVLPALIGALNPLAPIVALFDDRHKRKADKAFRLRQEEEEGELNLEKKRQEVEEGELNLEKKRQEVEEGELNLRLKRVEVVKEERNILKMLKEPDGELFYYIQKLRNAGVSEDQIDKLLQEIVKLLCRLGELQDEGLISGGDAAEDKDLIKSLSKGLRDEVTGFRLPGLTEDEMLGILEKLNVIGGEAVEKFKRLLIRMIQLK